MKFTLDLNKWRCGSTDKRYGFGPTEMKNYEGYMCCLGQFSEQIDKSCDIVCRTEPCDCTYSVEAGKNPFVQEYSLERFENSNLSTRCMIINDNQKTNVLQKIKQLKVELKKHGHELKIINDKMFDSKNRLINIKPLFNSVSIGEIRDFVVGEMTSKKFERISPFTRQFILTKKTKKAKEILKKRIKEHPEYYERFRLDW